MRILSHLSADDGAKKESTTEVQVHHATAAARNSVAPKMGHHFSSYLCSHQHSSSSSSLFFFDLFAGCVNKIGHQFINSNDQLIFKRYAYHRFAQILKDSYSQTREQYLLVALRGFILV